MGTRETIIYRLMIRNPSYDAYCSFLIFRPTFGGKMGMATTRAPIDLGPLNPTKKLAAGWTFWAIHYLKIMFSKFSAWTPPPLLRWWARYLQSKRIKLHTTTSMSPNFHVWKTPGDTKITKTKFKINNEETNWR